MRLVLVRATGPAFGDRLVGSHDVPLSPAGKDAARAAAVSVHDMGEVGTVYHPPSGHAAEAAALVAEVLGRVALRALPDLAELHLGLWQGLPQSELTRRHKDAFRAFRADARAVVPPEAEEVDAARERLGRALAGLRRRHRKDARLVVVVTSEFAHALLVAAAEGREAPPDLWEARSRGPAVVSFSLA